MEHPDRVLLFYLCRVNSTRKAHLALVTTTLIFGLAYGIVKSLMPGAVSPMQLIFIRMLGGVIIFWLFQNLFVPEKVDKKDLIILALCGMFGFALNQAFFYLGLNLTSPVDASLIHVLNPVMVMVFSTLILGEAITWKRSAGIALGATGVGILVLQGKHVSFSGTDALGNFLIFLNVVFYALYLVLIKPMVAKYHTTTVLKWVSFFGFLFVLPFTARPMMQIHLNSITPMAWLSIAYIIILNTFVAYLLINFALKSLTATVVSYYSYLQPFIAAVLSVAIGMGGITWPKILAALLIFTGVYMVNRPQRQTQC